MGRGDSHIERDTKGRRDMAEYAFTFGPRPCLIKTYVHVEIGGDQGYVAFPFLLENDGQ